MPKKKSLVFPTPTKVVLTAVHFTFDPAHFVAVTKYFAAVASDPSTAGSGLLQYQGFGSSDNSIFIGVSKALQIAVLRFTGENADALAQDFLSKLAGSFTSAAADSFKLVLVKGCIGMTKPRNLVDTDQLHNIYGNFLSNQQNSKVKAVVTDHTLVLGSKTGQLNVSIVGVTADSGTRSKSNTIVNVGATFKIQEKRATELQDLIKSNVAVQIVPSVCFFLFQVVNKYKMVPMIDQVRDILNQNSAGQNIRVPVSKTYYKTLSKEGQYVAKSLAGVKNKISDDLTTDESQKVFLKWLTDFKASGTGLSNSSAFFDQIADIFKQSTP